MTSRPDRTDDHDRPDDRVLKSRFRACSQLATAPDVSCLTIGLPGHHEHMARLSHRGLHVLDAVPPLFVSDWVGTQPLSVLWPQQSLRLPLTEQAQLQPTGRVSKLGTVVLSYGNHSARLPHNELHTLVSG